MKDSTLAFDFGAHKHIKKAAQESPQRRSGTVANTVRHALVHTPSPAATLHHTIIAACPHPVKQRADAGEYYMVAYVSIPLAWKSIITPEVMDTWDISFIGPSGTIQRLPPTMRDMDELLGERIYVGCDWLWLARSEPPIQQPHYEKIKPKLIDMVKTLRELAESAQ